jgi:hypothetical protein
VKKLLHIPALLSCLTALLLTASAYAIPAGGEEPLKESKKATQQFALQFDNKANGNKKVDSAYVIFDRYDLSGAGVIKKICYTDEQNTILIEDVPAGKYYVTIFTLGSEKQRFEKVVEVRAGSKKKKHSSTVLRIAYAPVYTPGTGSIPPEDTKKFTYVKF